MIAVIGRLQVKLPLEVGTFMECEWKEGQWHKAKIIERRKRADANDYEYYVHYIGCKQLPPNCAFALLWCSGSNVAPSDNHASC